MEYTKVILITGGAGFIGSHLTRLFTTKYPNYHIINLDKLTYAGNLQNLKDIEDRFNYTFIKEDICDFDAIPALFSSYKITDVIHCAAESHVDRSIHDPTAFIKTNVLGTGNLLLAAKNAWSDNRNHTFYHISTDEVYGSLGQTGKFTEQTPYDPRSPYSASKAGSDHLVRSYFHTYGFPVIISNCSNNYGPYQFPEKLIPLVINNIVNDKEIPVYGDGKNVRDWLYVEDHTSAIDVIFHTGAKGETYNIGGDCELQNIDLVRLLCDIMDRALDREEGYSQKLIRFVKDRPGHDRRYAIDATKILSELGWRPSTSIHEGLKETVDWYINNRGWLENIVSGDYRNYYKEQYQI